MFYILDLQLAVLRAYRNILKERQRRKLWVLLFNYFLTVGVE